MMEENKEKMVDSLIFNKKHYYKAEEFDEDNLANFVY